MVIDEGEVGKLLRHHTQSSIVYRNNNCKKVVNLVVIVVVLMLVFRDSPDSERPLPMPGQGCLMCLQASGPKMEPAV